MIVFDGQIYCDREHVEQVKGLPGYAMNLYYVIARTLAPKPIGLTRKRVAQTIQLRLRQL